MRSMKAMSLFIIAAMMLAVLSGCGVSKNRYEALLNEKIALEEKTAILQKTRDVLQNEYDNLLKDKMDIASRFTVLANEKTALKAEYDKLLDEKVTLRAAYDKLLADRNKPKETVTVR